MGLRNLIKWLTHTKYLEQSGKYEKVFYENMYRFLYVSGLSLLDNSVWYNIYSVLTKSSVGLFIAGEVWYLLSQCRTLNEVVENINVSLINLLSVYRYWHMTQNIDTFIEITKSTKSEYFDVGTKERQQLLQKWAKTNDKFFKLLLYLGHCTILIWYAEPFFGDTEYQLIVKMQLFYDYKTPALYPITYAMVVVWFTFTAYFVMVNDLILQTHLIHIICQFSILANCFENIIEDCAVMGKSNKVVSGSIHLNRVSKRFNDLVEQHNHLFIITEKLQRVISVPMLGQLTTSLMLICFAGFELAKAVNSNIVVFLTSLLYLSYNLFELFIFCRWCDEITEQSLNIRNAVYACKWERYLLPCVRAQLQFVIARASSPIVLTAGGIWDLSLATYSKILQKSYSGLTVLLQVQKLRP